MGFVSQCSGVHVSRGLDCSALRFCGPTIHGDAAAGRDFAGSRIKECARVHVCADALVASQTADEMFED